MHSLFPYQENELLHFRNITLKVSNASIKVPHLFCFLEWRTIVVIITISATAPMTEPATIPARLSEKWPDQFLNQMLLTGSNKY